MNAEPGRFTAPPGRREFLAATGGGLVAGLTVLTGCGRHQAHAGSTGPASPSGSAPGSAPASGPVSGPVSVPSAPASAPAVPGGGGRAAAALPRTRLWAPGPREVTPAAKRAAVGVIETLAAWPAGRAGMAAARARLARLGQDPGLAAAAGPLLGTALQAVAQVVDAQYGGILAISASVLVVVQQWLRRPDGGVAAGGTTVDVRLVVRHGRWVVTELHPAVPGPASRTPSRAERAVLAHPRLELPAAARADVASGRISGSVLAALLALAARHTVAVSVIRSGHPLFVFGTDRRSDHPRGRAVDIWAVDGRPVIGAATPRSLVQRWMREASALGPYQVGGPVDLDGGGSRYFSDATHQDHLHLGFHR